MLRAGLIQQVAAGSYSYLPIGRRVLSKVETIVRQEMERAGAVEVFLPTLQPLDWWEQTGRREAYGDNLFVITDRHGRKQALGPTHEEVITNLVDTYVSSYKQLPLTLYQIQTKFRDEFRPRFGVIRSREFQMKDAYSFHMDVDSLNETYQQQYDAYCRIFNRCGLDYVVVEAESGPIGGSASHEFMIPTPTGEDTILSDDGSDYAANVEKCEIGTRAVSKAFAAFSREPQASATLDAGDPTSDLEEVHTPGCKSIEDVCAFWKKDQGSKLKPQNMLKTLVYQADGKWLVAVVRGDHDLNEGKLKNAAGAWELRMAEEANAQSAGFAIGFVGPHVGKADVIYVDPDAAVDQFWVTGANKVDYHVKHFHWQRDVLDRVAASNVVVADLRNAVDGDPSARSEGTLHERKGIEVGHVFKLGTKYTDALDVTVLTEDNTEFHPIMGCYGIGVNRIIAAAIEMDAGHDDNGIIWPMAIAPYHVLITPIKYEGEACEVANDLYGRLEEAGIDVLLDDREERPGVKFKDADLIGIPLRITIGDKGLKNGEVEFKARTAEKAEMVEVGAAAERAVEFVRAQAS